MGQFRRGCQLLQLIWIQKMVPENLVPHQMGSNISASYTNSNISRKEGIRTFICPFILTSPSTFHDSFHFALQANALQRVACRGSPSVTFTTMKTSHLETCLLQIREIPAAAEACWSMALEEVLVVVPAQ